MDDREFCEVLHIERTVCTTWIERKWLTPLGGEEGRIVFRDVDVARARLLLDLETGLGVNSEGIDIIIRLVDQFYGLRMTLGDLVAAIAVQPPEVRRRILRDAEAKAASDAGSEPLEQGTRRGA